MEIKNAIVEQLLIQVSGQDNTGVPLGILNFSQSLKGKLRRKLQYLETELTKQYKLIEGEIARIKLIEKKEEQDKEFLDLTEEIFIISGFEKIPLSWIDEIETSKIIDIKFLLETILFDDTKK